jgi:hypothetical protein
MSNELRFNGFFEVGIRDTSLFLLAPAGMLPRKLWDVGMVAPDSLYPGIWNRMFPVVGDGV